MSGPTWVEIDVAALHHNAMSMRQLVPPGMQVAAVVKANAYGHGLREAVMALEPHVDAFQVDDLAELRAIRALTDRRVMVLGYVEPDGIGEASRLDGELALFAPWQLDRFRSHQVKAHVEIDAQLGRLGFLPEAVPDLYGVNVVGVYGHFGNIEDTTDQTHAYAQIDAYEAGARLVLAKFPNAVKHMSATSGLMTIEPVRRGYGLVRLGIGVYGLYPSVPLARTHAFLNLRPALRWCARLAQVKDVPAHHPIGYGMAYVTPRPMEVGIVPVGYSDGFDRGLSNTGEVLIRGQRCPVLGRVAMNMFTVDVTGVGAEAEDEVVLMGRQGQEEISPEEVAAKLGTIHYEVVARISPLLPRVTAGAASD